MAVPSSTAVCTLLSSSGSCASTSFLLGKKRKYVVQLHQEVCGPGASGRLTVFEREGERERGREREVERECVCVCV